jgi:hypothetical protein
MIGDDDPLLKALPPRGSRLGDVDAAALAAVDAREAVGEEELAAAAANPPIFTNLLSLLLQ